MDKPDNITLPPASHSGAKTLSKVFALAGLAES